MAEFKLGRIRFIWKGTWTTSTTYYKDDIVRNGGNTYICIKICISSSPGALSGNVWESGLVVSDERDWPTT